MENLIEIVRTSLDLESTKNKHFLAHLEPRFFDHPDFEYLIHPVPITSAGLKLCIAAEFEGWNIMFHKFSVHGGIRLINYLSSRDNKNYKGIFPLVFAIPNEAIAWMEPIQEIDRTVVQSLSSTSSGEDSRSEGSNPDDFVKK